jgi:hypothetical protein
MAADNIYAIATATAKKAGYSNFEEGSEGEKKREEIVLALKRRGMKKAQKYIRSGDLKMKDVRPGRDLEKKPYTSDELLRDNNPTVRRKEQRRISLEDYRANREAAKYQTRGERKKSVMEQRKPATPTPKDPNRVKQGKWEGGKWISNAVQEIWKATYGANNDQARKTGQRTSVERKPRLNPRKLGVSDILKAKLPTQPPLREPKIVEDGMEEDLYATGTVHGVEGLKRKNQIKKSLLWMLLGKEDEWALPKPKGSTVFSVRGKTKEQKKTEQKAGQKAMAERTPRSGRKPRTTLEAITAPMLQDGELTMMTQAEGARFLGTERGQKATKKYQRGVASDLHRSDKERGEREISNKKIDFLQRKRAESARKRSAMDAETKRAEAGLKMIEEMEGEQKGKKKGTRPEQGSAKTGAKWAQAKDRWGKGDDYKGKKGGSSNGESQW